MQPAICSSCSLVIDRWFTAGLGRPGLFLFENFLNFILQSVQTCADDTSSWWKFDVQLEGYKFMLKNAYHAFSYPIRRFFMLHVPCLSLTSSLMNSQYIWASPIDGMYWSGNYRVAAFDLMFIVHFMPENFFPMMISITFTSWAKNRTHSNFWGKG